MANDEISQTEYDRQASWANDFAKEKSDRRRTWQDHLKAAILDLRNSDRSPFEQRVYDELRVFAITHLA